MPSRPIRLASLAVTALLLCACSKASDHASRPQDEREASTAPDISPTAAPGVAFNYAYEFSLPDKRIAAAQEAHASACERLSLGRCRIVGMTYTVDQNEQVMAELDLKLDPLIARQFGKSAQQLVESNDGKLFRLAIGSSDEGQVIDQTTKQKSSVSAQIARLEQELAKTKPGTEARANLMSQIEALQQQVSEQTRAIESSQATLASTPMEFHYYGRGGVPGFRGNPVREAWQTFITTIVWLVKILLQVLAVLVPVGLLIAALVALWRTRPMRALRRWAKNADDAEV
jgi:hypothetical protein